MIDEMIEKKGLYAILCMGSLIFIDKLLSARVQDGTIE